MTNKTTCQIAFLLMCASTAYLCINTNIGGWGTGFLASMAFLGMDVLNDS